MPGRLTDAAASLLLGAVCPGCGSPYARLCPDCAAVVAAPEPFALAAGGTVPVVAAAPYDHLWRRVLVAYKERQAWWLAGALACGLALAVAESLRVAGVRTPGVVLVPMPSAPRSVRTRGLDTTLTIARSAARCLTASGLDARVEARLRHVRDVADQSDLGMAGRHANLRGALAARPGAGGVRVVVDDLTTTGASLVEACRALTAAGTPASGCAVVAATPRRDGRVGGDPHPAVRG